MLLEALKATGRPELIVGPNRDDQINLKREYLREQINRNYTMYKGFDKKIFADMEKYRIKSVAHMMFLKPSSTNEQKAEIDAIAEATLDQWEAEDTDKPKPKPQPQPRM